MLVLTILERFIRSNPQDVFTKEQIYQLIADAHDVAVTDIEILKLKYSTGKPIRFI